MWRERERKESLPSTVEAEVVEDGGVVVVVESGVGKGEIEGKGKVWKEKGGERKRNRIR